MQLAFARGKERQVSASLTSVAGWTVLFDFIQNFGLQTVSAPVVTRLTMTAATDS
jgi:hypothetical protein